MLLRAGDCAQGAQIRREVLRESWNSLAYQASYGLTLALCGGFRVEAQKIADDLARVEHPFLRGAYFYERARILAALGDREGAVDALQAGFRQGRPWPALGLHLDIAFEGLRDYPPYIELMRSKG